MAQDTSSLRIRPDWSATQAFAHLQHVEKAYTAYCNGTRFSVVYADEVDAARQAANRHFQRLAMPGSFEFGLSLKA